MNEISNLPPIDFGFVEDRSMRILKVVGVGGAGCNAVRNMYDEGIEGVSFAVCNTDSKVLSKSPVPVKLNWEKDSVQVPIPKWERVRQKTTLTIFAHCSTTELRWCSSLQEWEAALVPVPLP